MPPIAVDELAKRIETSPIIDENDFTMKKVSKSATELAEKYQISFVQSDQLTIDPQMSDQTWKAGLELLETIGIYSAGNRRQIQFSQDEILASLKTNGTTLEVGQDNDCRSLYSRKPMDSLTPIIFGGPFNSDIDPNLILPFNTAYASQSIIDVLFNPGHIRQIDEVGVRMNSALEMQSIIHRAKMTRQALLSAGRPGMPCVSQSSSYCGLISFNPQWGFRETDLQSDAIVPPLIFHDSFLMKLTYFRSMNLPLYIASVPLIGGFGGGPDGTAIVSVAEQIAAAVLGASVVHFGAQHVIYGQQSNFHSLWTSLLVNHAISRNSNIINTTSIVPAARPGHLQFFKEIAPQVLGAVIAGSHVTGPRTALLKKENQNTPLGAKLMGEIAHATTKLTQATALELMQTIFNDYKDTQQLTQHDDGKGFEELYDLTTLLPTPAHLSQYEEAKSYLQNLGIPLKG